MFSIHKQGENNWMWQKILQLVHWKSLYPLRVTQQSWLRRLCLALVGPALIQQFKGGGEPISGREVTADEQPLTPTGTQYQEHQSWAHMSITTASLTLSLSLLCPLDTAGVNTEFSKRFALPLILFSQSSAQCSDERGRDSVLERERAS